MQLESDYVRRTGFDSTRTLLIISVLSLSGAGSSPIGRVPSTPPLKESTPVGPLFGLGEVIFFFLSCGLRCHLVITANRISAILLAVIAGKASAVSLAVTGLIEIVGRARRASAFNRMSGCI